MERVMCEMRHRFGDTKASSDGCHQSEKLGPGWGHGKQCVLIESFSSFAVAGLIDS